MTETQNQNQTVPGARDGKSERRNSPPRTDGNKRLKAYVREVVAQVQKEYGMIHKDFRHDVEDALNTFVRALDTSLQALHLRMPMRFS